MRRHKVRDLATRRHWLPETLAKPEEAVFTDITAEWQHAYDPEEKIEQAAMRPPDIWFVALWASDGHRGGLLRTQSSAK